MHQYGWGLFGFLFQVVIESGIPFSNLILFVCHVFKSKTWIWDCVYTLYFNLHILNNTFIIYLHLHTKNKKILEKIKIHRVPEG